MAQYVYSILKPKGKFNIAEAIDIKYDDNKTLKDVITELSDNIASIKPGGDGSKELYIGTSQPYNTDLIWIDTSDLDNEILEEETILDQIRQVFSDMNQQIQELQTKVIEMQKEIDYMKENGSGSIVPTPSIIEDAFISENNYLLVDNNGYYLSFGDSSFINTNIENALVSEDNYILIDSNNYYISTI